MMRLLLQTRQVPTHHSLRAFIVCKVLTVDCDEVIGKDSRNCEDPEVISHVVESLVRNHAMLETIRTRFYEMYLERTFSRSKTNVGCRVVSCRGERGCVSLFVLVDKLLLTPSQYHLYQLASTSVHLSPAQFQPCVPQFLVRARCQEVCTYSPSFSPISELHFSRQTLRESN